jgi:hypothetical protein
LISIPKTVISHKNIVVYLRGQGHGKSKKEGRQAYV